MKLQQKIESSLEDIIKTEKKTKVDKKSKGITRDKRDKIRKLKGLNRNKTPGNKGEAKTKNSEEKPKKFSKGQANRDDNRPKFRKGGKKWFPPRKAAGNKKFGRKNN